MRSFELHAPLQQIQRSGGRSSVAAAAYRSASKLYDERTGLMHDYTKKQGVEHSRVYLPDNAPKRARDRSALWNGAEKKENRSNSCTAHELEVAFPAEFNAMQRREAGDAICHQLMQRYGSAVDIALHHPSKDGDQRNFHAHVMFTTRGFDETTKDGWAKKKFRDLSQDKITVGGEATTRGKQEVKYLREFTAGTFNEIAARDGLEVKTEHLSFEARGIDRDPQMHVGVHATAIQQKYKGDQSRLKSWRFEQNQKVILENAQRSFQLAQLEQEKKSLHHQIEQTRQEIARLEEQTRRINLKTIMDMVTGKRRADLQRTEALKEKFARSQSEDARKQSEVEHLKQEQIRAAQAQQKADRREQERLKGVMAQQQRNAANDNDRPPQRPAVANTVQAPPSKITPREPQRVISDNFKVQSQPQETAQAPDDDLERKKNAVLERLQRQRNRPGPSRER